MEFDLVYQIVTVIAVIIGSSVALFKMYYWYQDRKPKFTYEKVKEDENWHIMILHPDKPIQKISVMMNKQPLQLKDVKNRFERTMRIGEGQNFAIGKEPSDNAEIIINYDKYKIKKKWKDIPIYKHSF